MPTLQEQLEAAATQLTADSATAHDIVHGDNTTTVTTEGGPVKSLAKLATDLETDLTSNNVISQVTAIRDEVLAASTSAYVDGGGVADAYTATPGTAWTTYSAGAWIRVKIPVTSDNTGAATLDVSGLGVKAIKTRSGADPTAGDIKSGGIYAFQYDGTNFQFVDTFSERINAIGSIGGGVQDIDLTFGSVVTATVDTATTTFTFSNPTASDEGCGFTLILSNGGSQAVNWPASVDWAGGTAPTLTTVGTDVLVFVTVDGGTLWHGMVASGDSQ
ncbi:MAG: hypothetical protein HQL72_02265 [Magnetococcales bacterium]|nr:hypothetical protein [Magnetococcales bacterium]